MTHRFSHSIIDREKRNMWLGNCLIVAFLTIISGLQYHRDDIFEESGVHEEFHRPVRPQPPGRRIPEWSQFFYLRSSDQQEKPRGFSYHITNRNRPQFTFNRRHSSPFEETRQQDLQPRSYVKEKRRESAPVEQYYEPNYSREDYSPEDSREDEPTDSIEREDFPRDDLPRENETSTLVSRSGNIPEDPRNFPDPRPVYRDEASSSYRSQSDIYEKKESSKLIRDENNDNYPLYESDRQTTPEVTKVPRIPPVIPGQPDPLYGVVDTYLQFPPISFRFHISPHVQVLRPSELAIRQPPRIGFAPLVTVGNSSLPYPIVHGNKVRIQVVARGNGENPMPFTPTTVEETTPKSETEELSSSTTSSTVSRPTIPKLLAKILETTTLSTTEDSVEPTKAPIFTTTETDTTTLQSTTLSTEKEETSTETTAKTETTTATTVKPETTTKTTTESEITTTSTVKPETTTTSTAAPETTTTSTAAPETTTTSTASPETTTTSTAESETTTTTTVKPETTESQNINHDTTLMDVLVEFKSTEAPIDSKINQETTTESNIEETKSENIKVPCGSDANNKTNPFTISPKISTATSVIETRVDFVTTATVSERFSSPKEHKTKEDQNKDNLVFMAAENLEFW